MKLWGTNPFPRRHNLRTLFIISVCARSYHRRESCVEMKLIHLTLILLVNVGSRRFISSFKPSGQFCMFLLISKIGNQREHKIGAHQSRKLIRLADESSILSRATETATFSLQFARRIASVCYCVRKLVNCVQKSFHFFPYVITNCQLTSSSQ